MRIGIFGLENSSKTLHFQPMLSHNPYLTTHPPMQIPRTPPPKTATVLCPSSCSTIFREPYRLSSPRMVTTGTSSGLVTAVCGSPLNLFLTGTRYLRDVWFGMATLLSRKCSIYIWYRQSTTSRRNTSTIPAWFPTSKMGCAPLVTLLRRLVPGNSSIL